MATSQSQYAKVPEPVSPKHISLRSQWAARAIRDNLGRIQREAPEVPTNDADMTHIFPIQNSVFTGKDQNQTFSVGIVGAGVAGLFTAMIFDHLKDKFGLKVDYQILEANGERIGGRLYTYRFPQIKDQPPVGVHDYYDVGAMRFPEIGIMDRTFELFKTLSMEKVSSDQNRSDPIPKGSLIQYYLNGPHQPLLYNNVQVVDKKPVTAKDFKIDNLPPEIETQDAGTLIEDTIKSLKKEYKVSAEAFWERLMEDADVYTTRQYLGLKANYNFDTIEFLETMNFGNRWYDQALSEMVLESMDFDPDAPWWCVEGGAQEIAFRMQKKLKNQEAIESPKRVTAISYVNDEHEQINVTIDGEQSPRTYDAVFNSVPLGAMQQMQLEGLNLHYRTKSAIRSLGYGASCKVGIRFRSLWWIKELDINKGGQAKTDLPIRCCVYPSYNINDPVDQPGVLLASYTWSQEAERIGALIDRSSPENEEQLKEVLIHDLALLHSKTNDQDDYQRLHSIISKEYLSHYAYNWYANPDSVGAFAFFGPSQFSKMYPFITRNNGKYIIIGEAASAHHAWVVGALESAVRGVYQFLFRHCKDNKAAHDALVAYAFDQIEKPFGPLPAEFNRTTDVYWPDLVPEKKEEAQKHMMASVRPSPIGDYARMQVLFETIRMKQGGDRIDPQAITKKQLAPLVAAVRA